MREMCFCVRDCRGNPFLRHEQKIVTKARFRYRGTHPNIKGIIDEV